MAKKVQTVLTKEKSKTYNYGITGESFGEVTLNFTLSINNSAKLRAFRKLLEEALKDLSEDIEGMEN